jgi:hypothetical protein
MHGEFKVADTVLAQTKVKDYSRQQWEAALDKAEERAEPDEGPLIVVDDFYWPLTRPFFARPAFSMGSFEPR